MPRGIHTDPASFMQRALELARRGEGYVEPNPMVGCVLVRDGVICGEGNHEKFGGPHAEVNAIGSCDDPKGTTAFVTLEPCCHTGKTGPCTKALIDAGVAEVIVATVDPFAEVAGQGIEELKQAALQVTTGLLEAEARELNAPYFKRVRTGMPWVIAKWAMTLDGKIATASGSSKWISNEQSREVVHQVRGRMDAVVVGIGTALADDPLLTSRPPGPRTAWRVVVDEQASLPVDSQLVTTVADAPVAVAVGSDASPHKVEELRSRGVEIISVDGDSHAKQLGALLRGLGQQNFTNVLFEGGSSVLGALFDRGLVDEVHCFVAPKLVGGKAALSPVGGQGVEQMQAAMQVESLKLKQLGGDIYVTGRLGELRE